MLNIEPEHESKMRYFDYRKVTTIPEGSCEVFLADASLNHHQTSCFGAAAVVKQNRLPDINTTFPPDIKQSYGLILDEKSRRKRYLIIFSDGYKL